VLLRYVGYDLCINIYDLVQKVNKNLQPRNVAVVADDNIVSFKNCILLLLIILMITASSIVKVMSTSPF